MANCSKITFLRPPKVERTERLLELEGSGGGRLQCDCATAIQVRLLKCDEVASFTGLVAPPHLLLTFVEMESYGTASG